MGDFFPGMKRVKYIERFAIVVVETEASKQGFEDGPPITLSPLAQGDEKFFEPGTHSVTAVTVNSSQIRVGVYLD